MMIYIEGFQASKRLLPASPAAQLLPRPQGRHQRPGRWSVSHGSEEPWRWVTMVDGDLPIKNGRRWWFYTLKHGGWCFFLPVKDDVVLVRIANIELIVS